MQLSDIYDALFLGQTLVVQLPSAGAVHTFRAKLYKFKRQQDMILLASELIDSAMALSIDEEQLAGGAFKLHLKFVPRKPAKTYEVVILGEESADGTEA